MSPPAPVATATLRGWVLYQTALPTGAIMRSVAPSPAAFGPAPSVVEFAAELGDWTRAGWLVLLEQARATGDWRAVQLAPNYNASDLTLGELARVNAIDDALAPSRTVAAQVSKAVASQLRGLPPFAPEVLAAVPGLGPVFALVGSAISAAGGAGLAAANAAGATVSAPAQAIAADLQVSPLQSRLLPIPAAAAVALDPSKRGLEETALAQGALAATTVAGVVASGAALAVGAGEAGKALAVGGVSTFMGAAQNVVAASIRGQSIDALQIGASIASGAIAAGGAGLEVAARLPGVATLGKALGKAVEFFASSSSRKEAA